MQLNPDKKAEPVIFLSMTLLASYYEFQLSQ